MNLSIIIPVYNVEMYLDSCVRSVLDQDYDDYEIILVDDGSADGSSKMCDEYARDHERIRVIHKKNGGLGSARNAGLRIATGEYIMFLDSDDAIRPNCLLSLINIAENHQADIVLFCSDILEEDGVVHENVYLRRGERFDFLKTGIDGIKEELDADCYVTSVCMRLYNRLFLLSTELVFNESIIHEDEDYGFISYLKAKRVIAIDDKIYIRRYRAGSILDSRSYKRFAEGYVSAISGIYLYGHGSGDNAIVQLCTRYNRNLINNVIKKYCFLDKDGRSDNRETYREAINTIKEQKFDYGILYDLYFFLFPVLTPVVRMILNLKKAVMSQ